MRGRSNTGYDVAFVRSFYYTHSGTTTTSSVTGGSMADSLMSGHPSTDRSVATSGSSKVCVPRLDGSHSGHYVVNGNVSHNPLNAPVRAAIPPTCAQMRTSLDITYTTAASVTPMGHASTTDSPNTRASTTPDFGTDTHLTTSNSVAMVLPTPVVHDTYAVSGPVIPTPVADALSERTFNVQLAR